LALSHIGPKEEGIMSDRDILRDEIERGCVISGKIMIERDASITVIHGPKFIFTAEGEIKSIIRNGKAYGPDGQRPYVAPKGKAS
jgi:hypothetical protein